MSHDNDGIFHKKVVKRNFTNNNLTLFFQISSNKNRPNLSHKQRALDFVISQTFPCAYLRNQKESLLLLTDPQKNARRAYPALLEKGFRRSGDYVYRPHCQSCQECQSLRIPVNQFSASRSQKRLLSKNKIFTIAISKYPKKEYFELYRNYINRVHRDGVMYPASQAQYQSFIKSSWNNPLFIEIYDQDKLISVSVTDQVMSLKSAAWSAFYCFYDPDYRANSLGKYALLMQLKLAKEYNINWLYLGYYVEHCQKMNYKTQFHPHQRFINGEWIDFNHTIKKAFI